MSNVKSSKNKQEVCRVHSTPMSIGGRNKAYLDPNYIVGFTDGEGCFCISITKHKEKTTGFDVKLEFEIELRKDDEKILHRIQKMLRCGNIYDLNYDRYGWKPHVKLKISRLDDIRMKLVPFFRKHPLQAKKRRSFLLFCKAVKIFEQKKHLTKLGIKRLRRIQQTMNKFGK